MSCIYVFLVSGIPAPDVHAGQVIQDGVLTLHTVRTFAPLYTKQKIKEDLSAEQSYPLFVQPDR